MEYAAVFHRKYRQQHQQAAQIPQHHHVGRADPGVQQRPGKQADAAPADARRQNLEGGTIYFRFHGLALSVRMDFNVPPDVFQQRKVCGVLQ